jgi:hypothetical protein
VLRTHCSRFFARQTFTRATYVRYGFGDINDFEIYTEEELIDMGFKKVHARKLVRAALDAGGGDSGVTMTTSLSEDTRAIALAH